LNQYPATSTTKSELESTSIDLKLAAQDVKDAVRDAVIAAKSDVVVLTPAQLGRDSLLAEQPICLDSLESIAMVAHLEEIVGLEARDEHFFSGTVRTVDDVVADIRRPGVLLVHKAGALRILHYQTLALNGLLEELAFGAGNPSDIDLLAEHEALGDNHLLLVHGYHQHIPLLPGGLPLTNDLANRHVLDLDLFAHRLNFHARRHFVDLGADDDLADVAQVLLRYELLFA